MCRFDSTLAGRREAEIHAVAEDSGPEQRHELVAGGSGDARGSIERQAMALARVLRTLDRQERIVVALPVAQFFAEGSVSVVFGTEPVALEPAWRATCRQRSLPNGSVWQRWIGRRQ